MALLWCDGFTGYGSSNNSAPSPSGVMEAKYRQYITGEGSSKVIIDGGRVVDDCIEFPGSDTDYVFQPTDRTTNATLIAGIAYRPGDGGTSTDDSDWSILQFRESTSTNVSLILGNNRNIFVATGNGVVVGSARVKIKSNQWYYIEMKVYHDNTNGTIEVKLNSCPIIKVENVDTIHSPNPYSGRCTIGRYGDFAAYKNSQISDYYVCDGSGGKNNDFLGPVTVDTLFPDGDDTTDFSDTGNANYTTHYEQVNGKDALWLSDYVEDSTTGNQDIFTYQATQNFATIHGIVGWTVAKYVSTAATYKMLCESGNANTISANISPGSSFQTDEFVVEDDPDTSNAWTPSTINSMKFGLEIQ